MALTFLKNLKPGVKVDKVDFGPSGVVAGSFLVRIDERPVARQVFMFVGQSTTNDSGVAIGVDSAQPGALLVILALGGHETSFVTGVENQHLILGRWHRVSWCLTREKLVVWLDAETVISVPLHLRPEISCWDRIAFGNRYDVNPGDFVVGMIQDAAVWISEGVDETRRRHFELYNDGEHRMILDAFAHFALDPGVGEPEPGDLGLVDRAGTNNLNRILEPSAITYTDRSIERVLNQPYFGRVHPEHQDLQGLTKLTLKGRPQPEWQAAIEAQEPSILIGGCTFGVDSPAKIDEERDLLELLQVVNPEVSFVSLAAFVQQRGGNLAECLAASIHEVPQVLGNPHARRR